MQDLVEKQEYHLCVLLNTKASASGPGPACHAAYVSYAGIRSLFVTPPTLLHCQ